MQQEMLQLIHGPSGFFFCLDQVRWREASGSGLLCTVCLAICRCTVSKCRSSFFLRFSTVVSGVPVSSRSVSTRGICWSVCMSSWAVKFCRLVMTSRGLPPPRIRRPSVGRCSWMLCLGSALTIPASARRRRWALFSLCQPGCLLMVKMYSRAFRHNDLYLSLSAGYEILWSGTKVGLTVGLFCCMQWVY